MKATAAALAAASFLNSVPSAATLEHILDAQDRIILPSRQIVKAGDAEIADLSGNLKLKNIGFVVGSTPTPQQTSTSYAVIPEMTITVTSKGNKTQVIFTGSISSTAGGGAQAGGVIAIFKDGTQATPDFFVNTGGVTNCQTVGLEYIDTPTAASHTYDVRWKVGASGQTVEVQGTARTLQVVELG